MKSKIFDYDGPVMTFLSNSFDYFFLSVLCLICSLPIVTAGAAVSAKYYVAMKIARGESPTVIKPFFKAFKENFVKAFLVEITQLLVFLFIYVDYCYLKQQGWGNVNKLYLVAFAIVCAFYIFMNMTVYPLIARYEMSVPAAIKGAFTLSLFKCVILLLIVAIWVATGFLSVCYYNLMPLFACVGTSLATRAHSEFLVKSFNKIESLHAQNTETTDATEEGGIDAVESEAN